MLGFVLVNPGWGVFLPQCVHDACGGCPTGPEPVWGDAFADGKVLLNIDVLKSTLAAPYLKGYVRAKEAGSLAWHVIEISVM